MPFRLSSELLRSLRAEDTKPKALSSSAVDPTVDQKTRAWRVETIDHESLYQLGKLEPNIAMTNL